MKEKKKKQKDNGRERQGGWHIQKWRTLAGPQHRKEFMLAGFENGPYDCTRRKESLFSYLLITELQ